jgi:hypothetical protein
VDALTSARCSVRMSVRRYLEGFPLKKFNIDCSRRLFCGAIIDNVSRFTHKSPLQGRVISLLGPAGTALRGVLSARPSDYFGKNSPLKNSISTAHDDFFAEQLSIM